VSRLLLPDLDIWIRAYSRTGADPLVAAAFADAVRARRVALFGPLRQTLLMRARDARQSDRLRWTLGGFPTPVVGAADHEAAAERALALAGHGVVVSAWQALAWTVADRLRALVWSTDQRWLALLRHGCPVAMADGSDRG
jgi:hypothetical protein